MPIRYAAVPAVFAACGVLVLTAGVARPQPAILAPPPRPADPLRPPLVITDFGTYSGRVLALDHRSVTVQGITGITTSRNWVGPPLNTRLDFLLHQHTFRGDPLFVYLPGRALTTRQAVFTRERVVLTDADGRETIFRREDEPRFQFTFSNTLAGGGVGDAFAYRSFPAHRAGDVRVGDEVRVGTDTEDGKKVCAWVQIERRPGGRVPPAARDDGSERFPRYHDRMNALQDWEAGIPLAGRMREMYAHLLPEEPAVAPPPRELPPRIPAAAP